MDKNTSDSQFEPSAEEISTSIYYIRVIESYNNFQNSQNSDISISNFHIYLNDLNEFISNETNKNLIEYYIKSTITKIIQISSINPFNQENLTLLFSIIDKVFSITMDIDYSCFPKFLFFMMETEESIEILKKNKKTLDKLFSNEIFFTDFVDQQQTELFFELSFVRVKSADLCYLFRHLICEISPLKLRTKINLSKILALLYKPIKEEIQNEYSIVLFKLISISPDNRLFLNNYQNFFLFSNFIHSSSSEIIIECFNELVFTSPANLELFQNIILFYQKYSEHQNSLFQWIFNDIVRNHSNILNEMNDVVPFYGWVTKSTPVKELIEAILDLSKYETKFISPFLSPLFSLLSKNKPNFENFKNSIEIIESQILQHKVSLLDLANINFLNTFVIDLEIDLLGQLFERIYTFSQLVYDIYALPKSKLLRPDVVNKLIRMCGKYPKTSQFLSIFFVISNSKKNVSNLMKTITENRNGELCVALGNSFAKSDTIVKYFIGENGIEWLDKIFKSKLIDLQQFIFIINSLTKNKYVNEVDKYIQSLPKNHPIFGIVQEDLMTLSYGFENSHHLYPLKITSLFPFLKCPQKVDPYNAYMIGKHIFDTIPDKDKLPIFQNIVNRYINDESFQKIIEMNPSKFQSFCDLKYDHFPLFQINDFFDKNIFNVKYKAISFWFKFSDTVKKELKIPFFTSDKLQLYMDKQSIFVNYDGNEYDISVNPFKWNHVVVYVSSLKNSNFIYVYVNMNKDFFIPNGLLLEMANFEFSTRSGFLFIGSSIRIYQNDKIINDIETINKNGPSFLGHLHETTIITPTTLKNYLNMSKNTFAVEYRGFPSYFLSQRKKKLFFNRITNSDIKENEFILSIKTCFKLYLILKDSFNNFIPFLLSIYSKVPQFINENVLFESFDFFLKCKSKTEVINSIIAQQEFWSSVPIDLIITELFQSFYNFDFYKEKKQLEIFFAIKSFSSNGNSTLFKYLFQLQNCKEILNKLFAGSHFISKKQDKFTQSNFKIISDFNEVVVDQNNVSIQCNLNDNHNFYFHNFDSVSLFQTIKINNFQKNFAVFLNKMIIQSKSTTCIPLSSIYSLFITSNTKIRIFLYPILLNCEKIDPDSIQFDSLFLCLMPPMFLSKRVWIETFNFLTSDTTEITKPSILPVLFSLLWGYTVASIQSIASTGNQINTNDEINKIINFLSSEKCIKILSQNEEVQKFVVSWFPYFLGVNQPNIEKVKDGFTPQEIELNSNMVTSPSTFCFLSMIWRNVVNEANLPIHTKSEFYINLQSFIVSSLIFRFYFRLTFSMPDSILNEVVGSFFSIPFVSGDNEMTKCFMGYFTHSLLNIITENLSRELKVNLILPFINFVCLYGQINDQYLPVIVSDLLLISSVIGIVNDNYLRNLAHSFDLIFMIIFLSIIKIIKNDDYEKANLIKIIDALYQILYQQNQHFTKILSETQFQKDFYFQFFKQSSHFCSNKDQYAKFIKEFVNALNLNQDKKFQSLLNDNDGLSEKIEIDKWSDFIISEINQQKKDYLSFSYFMELSKSFTMSFLNELEKQHEISASLEQIFIETKKFEDLKY